MEKEKNCICLKKNEWFFEERLPGINEIVKTGIKIKKKVFSQKTLYQKIEIYDTFQLGRILVLDGIVQLSRFDDFIYHEMLVHPAMLYHKNPKKVLIIGGGDGGALREVLRYHIEEAYLADIDKKVIEISRRYLPFISNGAFKDKKTKIFTEDGIKFIRKYENFFDVIIVDSTDPIGPSLSVFSNNFYKDTFKALTREGILVVQSGCLLDQFSHLKSIYKKLKNIFHFVKIHKAYVPCFGCSSEYSFTVAGKRNIEKLKIEDLEEKFKRLNIKTKYYSPEIHFASAVLPKYLKGIL